MTPRPHDALQPTRRLASLIPIHAASSRSLPLIARSAAMHLSALALLLLGPGGDARRRAEEQVGQRDRRRPGVLARPRRHLHRRPQQRGLQV